ncbi:MAG: tyrosine-type recombinase/integrase [Gracilibacteraceae bacterium]|jgi:integrase|nr:tyrosine-type recombinase/integrase [Gracilibacteraceae bacterium]
MKNPLLNVREEDISRYLARLAADEKAAATMEKYSCAVHAFRRWLDGEPASQERAVAYKNELAENRAASGVNAALAALNGFFRFMEWSIRVKPLKIQRQTFLSEEKELTRAEYERLLQAAKEAGDERLYAVLQTICATGIRVSELRYVTVGAARKGQVVIRNKGKTRTAFLPRKLQAALLAYVKKRGISAGSVFITKNGNPLDRKSIWAAMKKLCALARVAAAKVFPHNLRRLFARLFYRREKDIMHLADILGHSDVNTTRLYVRESEKKHRLRVEALCLVT